jgi:hypothetical protein
VAKEPPVATERQTTTAVASLPSSKPVYKKWWLWTIVGGVAVATGVGVGLGVALAPGPQFDAELGTVGPGAASITVRY